MPETIRKFPRFIDGYYGSPVRISRTPREYPFRHLGDVTTAVYSATYLVDQGKFTPTAAGTVDPENAGFYLLAETIPEIVDGDLATFRRTYSNIPATQTVVTSVALAKPAIEGTYGAGLAVAYGDYRIVQPDTTLQRYDIYRTTAVTSAGGVPSFYPSGGTYTITFGGATTGALNYNDSPATIQTALNALTPVSNRGSVVVGGAYNNPTGITIAFSGYAQITLDTSSLTGGTILKSESLTNLGATQALRAWRDATGSAPTAASIAGVTWSTGSPAPIVSLDYTDAGRPRIASAFRFTFGSGSGAFVTGGSFTLSIAGHTTAAISLATTLGAAKAALQADLDAHFGAGVIAVGYWPDAEAYYGATWMDASVIATANWPAISFLLTFTEGGPAGGTFTITVGANTTSAIAYNATAATIQTALNALASVTTRGGVVVSGTLTDGIAVAFQYGDFTVDATSLTPTGSTITPSVTDDGVKRQHKLVFRSSSATRDLVAPNHGITAGGQLILANGSTAYWPVLNYLVVDQSTLRLLIAAEDAWASVGTFTLVGIRTKAGYTPGSRQVPARKITEFFLPGATDQPATADDIPIPPSQSDGPDLLEAIFAGTGTINWQVGELTQWRDSAILSLTRTTVRASDL
jgi:hypothetical protein